MGVRGGDVGREKVREEEMDSWAILHSACGVLLCFFGCQCLPAVVSLFLSFLHPGMSAPLLGKNGLKTSGPWSLPTEAPLPLPYSLYLFWALLLQCGSEHALITS